MEFFVLLVWVDQLIKVDYLLRMVRVIMGDGKGDCRVDGPRCDFPTNR